MTKKLRGLTIIKKCRNNGKRFYKLRSKNGTIIKHANLQCIDIEVEGTEWEAKPDEEIR